MAKGNTRKGKEVSAPRPTDKTIEAVKESRAGAVWIRKDGAICIGDECLVLKPSVDGKDLTVEIAPTRCGATVAEQLKDIIFDTIGRGGSTTFKIKGELKEEK